MNMRSVFYAVLKDHPVSDQQLYEVIEICLNHTKTPKYIKKAHELTTQLWEYENQEVFK